MILPRVVAMLGLAALLSTLSACASPDGSADGSSALVQIDPPTPDVEPGTTVTFIAHVGGTVQPASWSVVEPDGGVIDEVGSYTAPEVEGTYTVLASVPSLAMAETTQVRVKRNLRVDVSPSSATLAAGDSLAFGATVTGNVREVTWSVAQAPEGGSITAAGVYTAPATPGTYTVIGTSTVAPTQSGSATVTVTAPPAPPPPAPVVAIAIAPQTASVLAGNTVQFTATVTGATDVGATWSVSESGGGAVSATGLYTAPAAAGTYHVVATSLADGSKLATATVTVTAPPVDTSVADVTAYGARGDGVTDDTAAFQAAANTRKPLLVPAPAVRYRLTSGVRIYNSVRGDGSRPQIWMDGPSGQWGDSMLQIVGYAGTGLTISGLHLNGGWSGSTGGEWSSGVHIAGSQNVTVEDNLIENLFGDGVYVGGGNYSTSMSRNVTVRNNEINNPRRCNVAVIYVDGLTITGNTFRKSNTYVADIDIEPNPNGRDTTSNIVIDGNTFTSPAENAVSLYHASDWPVPSGGLGANIRISNNSGDVAAGVNITNGSLWSNVTQSNNVWR